MRDVHVHLQGEYTYQRISDSCAVARERKVDEIWFLEHTHLFSEFLPQYEPLAAQSDKMQAWYEQKAAQAIPLGVYLDFVQKARALRCGVKMRFGLEVCYLPETARLLLNLPRLEKLDFLTGAVHFVDGFPLAFERDGYLNLAIDRLYKRYFALSCEAAKSGLFDVLAHPDYIGVHGFAPSFSLYRDYQALAQAAREGGCAVERSAGGVNNYKNALLLLDEQMLDLFSCAQVEVLPASDAHCVADVGKLLR